MRGNEVREFTVAGYRAAQATIPMRGNETEHRAVGVQVWDGYDPHEG